MNNDPGWNGGNMSPLDKKKEILSRAMYEEKPTFKDFEDLPEYPRQTISSNKKWLAQKNRDIADSEKISSDDGFARDMEPAITYILKNKAFFPTREKNFSFLASDYDDKNSGTDIVFGISDKDGGNIVFSVDVASGTNPNSINKKFESTLRHNGVSSIEYCMHEGQKWREPDAPHFVLGMSPASLNKAVDKMIITDNELRGRKIDTDSDFMLLSEIREQVRMHLANLENKPKAKQDERVIAKLKSLQSATKASLQFKLGVKKEEDYSSREEYNKVFNEKYKWAMGQLSRADDVYNNIVSAARQRTIGARASRTTST